MELPIQEELQYVLHRGNFEYGMAINNMAFMLSQHMNDIDDSYLSSDLFMNLQDKLIEKYIQRWIFVTGVVINTNKGKYPKSFCISKDNDSIEIKE